MAANAKSRMDIPERHLLEFVEENAAQAFYPVYIKYRPLRESNDKEGTKGIALKGLSRIATSGHWALEFGSYTYELTVVRKKAQLFVGQWDQTTEGERESVKRIKVGLSNFTTENAYSTGRC